MTGQLGRLAKSALIYGTGEVLTKILGFLMLPLFTAYLTPDDYGINAILASVTYVLGSIFSLGFGSIIGILYFENDSPNQRPTTLWTSVLLLSVSALLMTLVTIIYASELSTLIFRTPIYANLLIITSAATAFNIISTPFSFHYQFEQKATAYTAISLVSAFLYISLTVVMVSVLRMGIFGWVAATLLGQGISLILYAVPVMSQVPFRLRAQIAKSLLRLGLPLVPSFVFLFILLQSNRFFLERISGLDTVGIYAIGSSLGMTINMVIQGFTRAWFPYFLSFTDKQNEAKRLFSRITTYFVVFGGILTLCFFLFARPVVLIMTAPAFHEAYSVIGWVALAQFFTGLFNLLIPSMYFAQQVRVQTPIQAAASIVLVLACLVLIPLLGAMGAALALVAGTLTMCILTYLWNQAHPTYFQVKYEVDRIIKFSIGFLVLACFTLIPREFTIAADIVFGLIGLFAISAISYLLIDVDEKIQLANLLRRYILNRLAPPI
ncbi:MAG: oligosaccharide flippase family protein [Chloroflexi bacterium]|nr:oligosaccharide flippase family protein [Chloroflexota bacterium]